MSEQNFQSEIVNQKQQFVFDVEATSDHVFEQEPITFYIYMKNISGADITNFTVKIEKPDEFFIKKKIQEHQNVTLESNQTQLYDIEGFCQEEGEFFIHFIAYGDQTQIAHKVIKINCSQTYNSDKLIHKIHIYDFSPYESKFSLEADNYSEEVTQVFKRQKLPYKAGQQPFPLVVPDDINNIESECYLKQYERAKNTKEHVYQYISRENFTEESLESYSGENLFDLINKINKESEYFKAQFFRSGTNHLLNDFTQYKPNGFIYRMGLLSSEIYHTLGIIPTFEYMNDKLFRWAPSPSGKHLFYIGEEIETDSLINLYPKQTAMRWDENVWAGRGWMVYKVPTEEYIKTDEFKKKIEDKLIDMREKVGTFEEKREAEFFIEQSEFFDSLERESEGSDLVKFEYEMVESLYNTGVFFVNIPIDKIPSNFYLIDTEDLYNIINRVKPYGMKPIINYTIERIFDISVEQEYLPIYGREFLFELDEPEITYEIAQNKLTPVHPCGNENFEYLSEEPAHKIIYQGDINIPVDISYKNYATLYDESNISIEQEYTRIHSHEKDMSLKTINDIKDLLYKNNYNNISFSTNVGPQTLGTSNIDYIRLALPAAREEVVKAIDIKDTLQRHHRISVEYDSHEQLAKIQYIYENTKGKSFVRKEGRCKIDAISVYKIPYLKEEDDSEKGNNRIILLFMVDFNKTSHYFYHTIIQGIEEEKTLLNGEENNNGKMVRKNAIYDYVTFETPYCYNFDKYNSESVSGGENWTNLYRLNQKENTYCYIENKTNNYVSPNDIYLFYDDIDIQETSIIKKMRLRVIGSSLSENQMYLGYSNNTNYRLEEAEGNLLQLRPDKIEAYSNENESTQYYQAKLETALLKDQTTLIEEFKKLIDENLIFNDDIDVEVSDYLEEPNDFFKASKPCWFEISEFTNNNYNLNNISNISLVIEGYNESSPIKLKAQTLSETSSSSEIESDIPSGYFYKKIPLLYPNNFLLDLLRIRFRFESLSHDIKIFNTSIECKFKNKETDSIIYEEVDSKALEGEVIFDITEDYIYPADINNGVGLKLSFDDLRPGGFYHIHAAYLEIITQDTDIDLMVNKSKYQYIQTNAYETTVEGISEDAYLSGLFYNDFTSISQIQSNVGVTNKGVKLKDALFQSFEARADNITSIEIYPYGFIGNPDESLKIGLYTNKGNTPDKLIKEIYANGWTNSNEELKNLYAIKYNLNIEGLKEEETYWFKIEVLNPKEESYYVLTSINENLPRHRLLLRENNNYINTFSTLTFNIYSRNLSESFNQIPATQEVFDNPYILLGLHKGQGTIKNLILNKWMSTITGEEHMSNNTELEIMQSVEIIQKDIQTGQEKKADLNKDRWVDING